MLDMRIPEVLSALECFIAAQKDKQSLPEAVNAILMNWLIGRGCRPFEELPESDGQVAFTSQGSLEVQKRGDAEPDDRGLQTWLDACLRRK